MGFKDYIKQELAKDPVVRLGRRLFVPRTMSLKDESTWYYREARRYLNYASRKFNLSLAVNHLKEAIRLAPQNADYHSTLGQALLLAPSFAVIQGTDAGLSLSRCAELAIGELEKAVRSDPNHIPAHYYMALGYDYMGQKEKAKERCRIALKLSPSGDTRTLIERYLKVLEGPALEDKTIANLEQESLSHLEQAVAYRREGKQRLAIKEFEKGCGLSPNSAWLYRTLCRLGSASEEVK